ncbi:MAG TPA: hypothetical protein VHD56_04310 [Tepidisphaeraceae bacterium]|nr:hypothetical protein [Tepidisphaeraceae bacterium]
MPSTPSIASRRFMVFVIASLLACSQAWGWSFKEHIQFARIAVYRLLQDPQTPDDMKAWLKDIAGDVSDMSGQREYFLHTHVGIKPEGLSGISYWVCQPDIHALEDKGNVKIEPFGVHERLLHFIDLEMFVPGDTPRNYQHDLSHKPAEGEIPHDMHDARYIQAGMLPFRIEQCYNELVNSIRAKQFNAPTLKEQELKTAVYWGGYLAHYLADNTQPQHTTMDYKSQSYFADKRRSPNVHAEVEYRMCDDEVNEFQSLRQEFWRLFVKQLEEFKDPVQSGDLFHQTLEVGLKSYDALPLIGLAAMHATDQGGTPQHPQGSAQPFDTDKFFRFHGQYMGRDMSVMEMKAIQTAWAVQRIERILRQAWIEASH